MKAQKSRRSSEERSIKDWERIFSDLYSEADSKRTPEQMWIAVMAHTSSIGESIRLFAFERLMKSAAHTFCWLCSFVNRCKTFEDDVFSIKENLCEIVSLKYPGGCAHCGSAPCTCDPEKIDRREDKSAAYKVLLDRRELVLGSFENYSIANCTKMFDKIYGGRIHIQTLENIGFHFLEEIGEAAVSIRKLSQLRKVVDNSTGIDLAFLKGLLTVEDIVQNYAKYRKKPEDINWVSTEPDMLRARLVDAKMGLVIEIGDSFSWFCAILNKLDKISKTISEHPRARDVLKPLEQVLTNEYFDAKGNARCPTCKNNPCKCSFFS